MVTLGGDRDTIAGEFPGETTVHQDVIERIFVQTHIALDGFFEVMIP